MAILHQGTPGPVITKRPNRVIASPDKSQGYLGFSMVTPPQRFPFRQCHKRYCFVTLTFNFKVTGGLLKVRFWPFFSHFGPVPIYRKLDHPMGGINNT